MSSKLYLTLLEKVAKVLLQNATAGHSKLSEQFPNCKINDNRFEMEGYVFYINFNGDDPEIAVTQGKTLPIKLLLKIGGLLCGQDWFSGQVLTAYKATHEEAVVALEKVKELQLDLIEFRKEMGADGPFDWVASLLRDGAIIGRIDKALADIKTMGGLEVSNND